VSIGLILFYLYAAIALGTAMWLLKELRQHNEDDFEDSDLVLVVIVFAVFWPIVAAWSIASTFFDRYKRGP
jgi:hypothetical protein